MRTIVTNKTFLVVLIAFSIIMLLTGLFYLVMESEMVFLILSIPFFFILLFHTSESKHFKLAAQIGSAIILLIGLVLTLFYQATEVFWRGGLGFEIILIGLMLILSGIYLLSGCNKYILQE